MTRKTIVQLANEARERTRKCRAAKVARRAPESRQIDKAMLLGILHVARSNKSFALEGDWVQEAVSYAVKLVARHHDPLETAAVAQSRLNDLARSKAIRDMLIEEKIKAGRDPRFIIPDPTEPPEFRVTAYVDVTGVSPGEGITA